MDSSTIYLLAADTILLLHALFVAFVVFGLLLIFIGRFYGWQWIRNPWLRSVHLLSIAFVVVEAWLGVLCPLTTLEMALRERAGEAVYGGSFIAHWLGELMYYQFPWWLFVLGYTIFGVIVFLSWFWVRPHRFFDEK
jgi:hypothetical protein